MVKLLASALRDVGELQGSLAAYQRLASDRERFHGAGDPRTLKSRDYLAYQLLLIGERERALEVFKRLYVDQVRHLGEDHPDSLHARKHIKDLES
jgi:hypothetical protein